MNLHLLMTMKNIFYRNSLSLLCLFILLLQGNSLLGQTTQNAGNWSTPSTWVGNAVPAVGASVTIAHDVTLDFSATVNNLTINGGATLTQESILRITGNWINNGTFSAGTTPPNFVSFEGGNDQTVTSVSPITFTRLRLTKTFPTTSSVTFLLAGQNVIVTENLDLSGGRIILTGSTILDCSSATTFGYTPNSWVETQGTSFFRRRIGLMSVGDNIFREFEASGAPANTIIDVRFTPSILPVITGTNPANGMWTIVAPTNLTFAFYNTGASPSTGKIHKLQTGIWVEKGTNPSPFTLQTPDGSGTYTIFTPSDPVFPAIGFSPTSGKVADPITITGTGFATPHTNNTVYFGDVKATSIAGTTTSLTVRVPQGSVSQNVIYVRNNTLPLYANSLIVSPYFFRTTNASSSTVTNLRYNASSYSTSSNSRSSVIADFNNDDNMDLYSIGSGQLFLGNGDGTLGTPTLYTIGNQGGGAAADFNGDGNIDVIILGAGGGTQAHILLGNGLGGLNFHANIGDNRNDVEVADMDNDGDMDLVIANFAGNNVRTYINDGAANFTYAFAQDNRSLTNATDVFLADFNRDGFVDIASGAQGTGCYVALNDGSGRVNNFTAWAFYNYGQAGSYISGADFDNDGDIDLVGSGRSASGVFLMLNNGNGLFSVPSNLTPTGSSDARGLVAADFNNDGNADIAYTQYGSGGGIRVRLGNGNGTFQTAITLNTPATAGGFIQVADFNNDNYSDFNVAYLNGQTSVHIYKPILYSRQNGNWNNPNTWSKDACGGATAGIIPDQFTDVVICNNVTLNANSSCKDLTINASSNLDVTTTNYALNITGNWVSNGTFNPRSGTVTFSGTAQDIGGSGVTDFNNITFNNPTTASTVSLFNSVNVQGGVTFGANGPNGTKVTLGNHNFTVNGDINAADNNSYFVTDGTGNLIRPVASATVLQTRGFPIGYTSDRYTPVAVRAELSHNLGNVSVKVRPIGTSPDIDSHDQAMRYIADIEPSMDGNAVVTMTWSNTTDYVTSTPLSGHGIYYNNGSGAINQDIPGTTNATSAVVDEQLLASTVTYSFGVFVPLATPDYTIITSGTDLIITDQTGNISPETLTITQSGTDLIINNSDPTRTYKVNGNPVTSFATSATVPLSGITSITINAEGGDDIITIGAFSSNLPSLTIKGGTGTNTVNFNGDITFDVNENLLVQTDINEVNFAASANVVLQDDGKAEIEASRNILFNTGSSLATAAGNITLKANQQATPTTGDFKGIDIRTATIQTTNGIIDLSGRGGDDAMGEQFGVRLLNGSQVIGGSSNSLTITGTGGASTGSSNYGVRVIGAASLTSIITSTGGDVNVIGFGGGSGSSIFNCGVAVQADGKISAGNMGKVTVTGTGGNTIGNFNYGVHITDFNSEITSNGGEINVTGFGGGSGTSNSNRGINLQSASTGIRSVGNITVTGTGGGSIGGNNWGVNMQAGSGITSTGTGTLSVNGNGGAGTTGDNNIGVNILINSKITSSGTGTVTVTGNGGTGAGDNNHGILLNGIGSLITSSGGTVNVTGTKGGSTNLNTADIFLEGGQITSTTGNIIIDATTAGGFLPATTGVVDVSTTSTQSLQFAANSTLRLMINGTDPLSDYDQLNVAGNIDLNGAELNFYTTNSFNTTVVAGDVFTIVENDGTDAINGTFNGLPEGAIIPNFLGSTLDAQITYTGGSPENNDVVLEVVNPPLPTQPIGNRGMYFDGVDDYVDIGSGTSLDAELESTSFTISAWIKLQELDKIQTIFSKWQETAASTVLFTVQANNRLKVKPNTGLSGFESTSALQKNKWTHVAATYDGAEVNLFIDGLPAGTTSYTLPFGTSSQPIRIGAAADDGGSLNRFFDGQLDEVKVFSEALSAGQIQATMASTDPMETDLIGYWDFGTGFGSEAADETANGNNGTLTNAPLWALRVKNENDTGIESLRQVIIEANGLAGKNYIDFSIPTSFAPFQIDLATNLDPIDESIFIDGTSQEGFVPYFSTGMIRIDGGGSSNYFARFMSTANNSEVYGLWVSRFNSYGVMSQTDDFQFGAVNKGNVISQINDAIGSGNALILDSGNSPIVKGNRFGTTPEGTAVAANAGNGINVNAATNSQIGGQRGTTIGDQGEGNLISGNTQGGIIIFNDGHTIQGNLIGTNITQDAGIPNGTSSSNSGIRLNCSSCTSASAITNIGGSIANRLGNIIGYNSVGISIGSPNVRVQGNLVGINQNNTAIPNAFDGVSIDNYFVSVDPTNIIIGSNGVDLRNIISNNTGMGVTISGGNGSQVIGNSIYNNGVSSGYGVRVASSTNNKISQNSIYQNTSGGIQLSAGNNGKVTPIIDIATPTLVSGTCVLCSNGDIIEVFRDNVSTVKQGQDYLGSTTVDGSNNWSLSSFSVPLTNGDFITATATDVGTTDNDTSPFSAAEEVTNVEINVEGNGNDIADGDNTPVLSDDTDFGNISIGTPRVVTYTIQNTGTGNLIVSSIIVSGTNSAKFVVGNIILPNTITGIGDVTFDVTFTPTVVGSRTATITINNNDADEAAYDFAVIGNVTCPVISLSPTTLTNGTANSAYTQTLTSGGGVGPYLYALSTGALPAGLTLASNGDISGTPTVTGTFPFDVTSTDGNGCTGVQSYSLSIGCPVISLSPTTLSNGTANSAYTQTLTSGGGVGIYAYTLTSGSLPTGLTLVNNGDISGTPTVTGTFPFDVTSTDGNGCTGVQSYSLSIGCPVISLSPTTLSNGTANSAYTQTLTSGGGVGIYAYTLTSGSLPTGLTLVNNGDISGTPTVTGTFPFDVTSTDGNGCTGVQSYSLSIGCPVISLSPTTLSNGTANSAYTQTLTSSGGVGIYAYTLTSGSLPTGLTLASNGDISGTPTVTGTFPFDVTSTDGNGCTGVQSYSLSIGCPVISLSPTTLSNGTANSAYTQTLTSGGGVGIYAYTLTSGSLPTGLTLASNGDISGTPTVTGTFPFDVTSTDGNGCTGVQSYSLSIGCPVISLSPTTLSNGTANSAYTQTLTSGGGVGIYAYTLTSGSLPTGLTLVNNGDISGTPTVTGTFPFDVTSTDGNGCTGVQSYSLSIGCPVISLSPTTLSNGTANSAYTQTLTSSGGVGIYAYTLTSGSLPTGLTLASNGDISGTPTVTGTFPFDVTSTDGNGCTGVQSYSLSIGCPVISLSPTTLSNGTANSAYTQTLTSGGGVGIYAYTLTSGSLPTGLTLASNGDISGTPTVTGTFPFDVTSTDGNGCTGVQSYSLSIGCPVISLSPTTLSNGTANSAYTQTLTSGGGVGIYAYTLTSGSLPTGLTLVNNGDISGTPTVTGTFPFDVTSTDGNGCTGVQSYSLSIGCPVISLSPTTLSNGTANSAYTQTLTSGGGVGIYAYTLTSGSLPTGLTLASNGDISGTPTVTGTFPFDVTSTDGNGCTGVQSYSLSIGCPVISLSPTTLSNGTANSAYTQTLTSGGGVGIYAYTLTSGSLPTGLTLASNGDISGTPTVTGTFPFDVTSTDGNGCTGVQSYSLSIGCPVISLSPTTLSNGTANSAYTQTLTSGGGVGIYAYTLTSGSLPTGLTLVNNGDISGTPTVTGTFPFDVTSTDGNGCTGVQSYSLSIGCPVISLSPTTLSNGTANSAYTQTLTSGGGVGIYAYTLTSGSLPTGLTLASNGDISGTPTVTGTFPFDVTSTDGNGCTGVQSYSLSIGCPVISLSPTTLSNGTANSAYTQTLTSGGGVGIYAYTLTSGSLPTGLTLVNNGDISGTPTVTGTFPFDVTSTDGNGCTGVQSYSLSIGCPVISLSPTTLSNGTANSAYTQTLTSGGGVGIYAYTLTSGSLPTGLTLVNNGDISGTPTVTGTFPFDVTSTDGNGCTGVQSYSLTIDCPVSTATLSITSTTPVCPNTDINFIATTTSTGTLNYKFYVNGNLEQNSSSNTFTANGLVTGNTVYVEIENTVTSCTATSNLITMTVADNQPPVLTPQPNFTKNTDPTNCYYTNRTSTTSTRIPNGTAIDNCGVASYRYVLSGATLADMPSLEGIRFNTGVTNVSWTATDLNGNVSSPSQFTITVIDNRNPVIEAPQNSTRTTNLYGCTSTRDSINIGTPIVRDNCLFRVFNNAPAEFPIGETIVIWTAIDSAGNQSSAEQIITIREQYFVAPSDSLILVQIYNEMGGSSWTTPWNLNNPVSTWRGVNVRCGKVASLDLSSNNLTGVLPASVLNLARIAEPSFSLNIGGNRLSFESAEDFVNRIPNFTYSPQAEIYSARTETVRQSESITFNSQTEGNFNNYQWYKDQSPIVGATGWNYTITSAVPSDAGVYVCEVTNTQATRLTLQRRPITLIVEGFLNETDSLALVTIFEETGGTSWTEPWTLTDPVSTWDGVTLVGDKIRELDLSSRNMTGRLPNVFDEELFSELRYLSFFDNQLEGQIPASLGAITTLTYLDLDKNQFEGAVPASLGNLINLQSLWLSRNNLTSLPDAIGNLTSLRTLYLNDNKFTELPATLGNLTELLVLNVSDNELLALPSTITNLRKLIQFYANRNYISTLPTDIERLADLTVFEINTNNLTQLPNGFLQLSSLVRFRVAENELEFDDLLPYANQNYSVFDYAPQAPINEEEDILVTLNSSVSFSIQTQGSGNVYQWFRNGTSVAATQNFTINRIRNADAGLYTAQITNPSLPDLILQRRSITVNVECQTGLNFAIQQPTQTVFCENQPFGLKLEINSDLINNRQIRWRKDGVVLAFANERDYTVTRAGTYTAEVITAEGCTALSNVVEITVLPQPELSIEVVDDQVFTSNVNSQESVTYQWLKDGTVIENATESTYTPIQTGEYSLLVKTESGCSSISETIIFTADDITGIEEPIELRDLSIFPNPNNGTFFIDFGTNTPNGKPTFILIDAIGRKIILKTKYVSSTRYKVNTNKLSGGMYYLQIETKDGLAFRKFVIEE